MTIDGPTTLFYTLSFLVPGFILHSVAGIFVPQRTDDTGASFLRYLTWSCINYAPWVWLIYLVLTLDFFHSSPLAAAGAWMWVTFVSPVAMGVLLGHSERNEWARKLLQRMGLRPIHSIPAAWDYKFGKQEARWLLVTLKDGAQVAGFFGSESFASSDPNERDLYLQWIYQVSEKGDRERVTNSDGMLIKGEEIRHVEFWYDE